MSVLPDKVSHGGTYAGNRVAAAAAVATLRILRDTDALATIHQVGREVQAGLSEVISERGLPYVFTGHPAMFGIMFTEQAPTEYRDWANSDHDLYDAVAMGMHARGAMPEPDSREPWFFCEAHAPRGRGRPDRHDLRGLARRGPRGTRPGRGRARSSAAQWSMGSGGHVAASPAAAVAERLAYPSASMPEHLGDPPVVDDRRGPARQRASRSS